MPRDYVIKGDRVGLATFVPEDEQLLYELWHDPTVQRNLNFRTTGETLEEWRARMNDPARPSSWLRCAIVLLDGEQFIGQAGLGLSTKQPELVILLLPAWRAKGYGTEAARLVVEHGFGQMRLQRIAAGALEFNEASLRMLEKVGFTRDPEHDEIQENPWQDGTVTELSFRLDMDRWRRLHAPRCARQRDAGHPEDRPGASTEHAMEILELLRPTLALAEAYLDMCRELIADDPRASEVLPTTVDEVRRSVERWQEQERVGDESTGGVPESSFWLVRNGSEVLGSSRLRHRLTPAQEATVGHVDYGIRPSARRRGYGTRLLAFTLAEAQRSGMREVLVMCRKDNVGSVRVIERNGGVLSGEYARAYDGEPMLRYSVHL